MAQPVPEGEGLFKLSSSKQIFVLNTIAPRWVGSEERLGALLAGQTRPLSGALEYRL